MKYTPTSLYYRLNPEHLDYLLSTEPSFPATIGGLLNELRTTDSWIKLSYVNVCELVNWLRLPDYAPHTIDSIFTTK